MCPPVRRGQRQHSFALRMTLVDWLSGFVNFECFALSLSRERECLAIRELALSGLAHANVVGQRAGSNSVTLLSAVFLATIGEVARAMAAPEIGEGSEQVMH